jgi:DNA polymerase I-like protein with 3'-5' exonuclease and polymerase domains
LIMRPIQTSTLNISTLSNFERDQVYNGADVCLTYEIHSKLSAQNARAVYNFELALQAPVFEMSMRGMFVDKEARASALAEASSQCRKLEETLDYFGECLALPIIKTKNAKKLAAGDYIPKYLNARSDVQLRHLFYEVLGMERIRKFSGGEISYPMDQNVLDKLKEYLLARPLARLVLEIRACQESIKRLRSEVSADGRAHTSYSIGGTTTGRFASSSWIDETRQNLQNVAPELRYVYIADPGWKIASIDREQAESRMVGWICWTIFGKCKYLDFCEKRDVHTHYVRLVWPEDNWTGDDKIDKKAASVEFLYGLSKRDICKRLGHGSNYFGSASGLAEKTYMPKKKVIEAQEIYFEEFPEIKLWHEYVIKRIKESLPLVTPFGWEINFLGHPQAQSTHREAIAAGPQSGVAHLTNLGLWRVWKHFGPRIRLLQQGHDSVVFMYREDDDEDEILKTAISLTEVKLTHAGRTMIIPGEAKIGFNWGDRKVAKDGTVTNDRGLRKWEPK